MPLLKFQVFTPCKNKGSKNINIMNGGQEMWLTPVPAEPSIRSISNPN
jgi:hypothetical protein